MARKIIFFLLRLITKMAISKASSPALINIARKNIPIASSIFKSATHRRYIAVTSRATATKTSNSVRARNRNPDSGFCSQTTSVGFLSRRANAERGRRISALFSIGSVCVCDAEPFASLVSSSAFSVSTSGFGIAGIASMDSTPLLMFAISPPQL